MGVEPNPSHTPVLLTESLELLGVVAGGSYCDATLGGGGHAAEILTRSAPNGRLLGIDRDPEAIERCAMRLHNYGARAVLRCGKFGDLAPIARDAGFDALDGVLADLGVSSYQLEDAQRGFSFMADGPLDMRMDPRSPMPVATLIATQSEAELAQLLDDYGEERYARRIARAIKRAQLERRLNTTGDLRDVVCRAQPRRSGTHRALINPATRTFQALRIAANDELGELERFLEAVFCMVKPGGTVVVIAFHSLEDRIVKRAFAHRAKPRYPDSPFARLDDAMPPTVALLTPKPIRPASAEIAQNPRARSAKLRAAKRLR